MTSPRADQPHVVGLDVQPGDVLLQPVTWSSYAAPLAKAMNT